MVKARHALGAPLVISGDTGTGKSHLLALYSLLINHDAAHYTEPSLHLVTVLRVVAAEYAREGKGVDAADIAALAALQAMPFTAAPDEALAVLSRVVAADPVPRAADFGGAIVEYLTRVLEAYPLMGAGLLLGDPGREASSRLARLVPLARAAAQRRADLAAAAAPADVALQTDATIDSDWGFVSTAAGLKTLSYVKSRAPVSHSLQDVVQCADYQLPAPPKPPAPPAEVVRAPERLALATPLAAGTEADLHSLFRGEADLMVAVTGLVGVQRIPLFERLLAHEAIDAPALEVLLVSWVCKAQLARRFAPLATFLCFVDELNTLDAPGALCEVFKTRCWMGRPIDRALFFVGAVNPHGRAASAVAPTTSGALATTGGAVAAAARQRVGPRATGTGAVTAARTGARRRDRWGSSVPQAAAARGDTRNLRSGGVANFNHLTAVAPAAAWTQGSAARTGAGTSDFEEHGDYLPQTPFLVRPVSASMAASTVTQARQDAAVERDFIGEFTRMRPGGALPQEFVETVLRAQELVRSYSLPRVHISIRDPVKCLRAFDYLAEVSLPTALDLRTNELTGHTNPYLPERTVPDHTRGMALLAAVGAVYYARLPSLAHVQDRRMAFDARAHFERQMEGCIEALEAGGYVAAGTARRGLRRIVADGHKHLWKHARDTPVFVTPTAGLQEAFWNFVLSVHTRVPVLMTGPPGW